MRTGRSPRAPTATESGRRETSSSRELDQATRLEPLERVAVVAGRDGTVSGGQALERGALLRPQPLGAARAPRGPRPSARPAARSARRLPCRLRAAARAPGRGRASSSTRAPPRGPGRPGPLEAARQARRSARPGARQAAPTSPRGRPPRPRSRWRPNGTSSRLPTPTSREALAELVVERPAQGARGGERFDLGDHASKLVGRRRCNLRGRGTQAWTWRASPLRGASLVAVDHRLLSEGASSRPRSSASWSRSSPRSPTSGTTASS